MVILTDRCRTNARNTRVNGAYGDYPAHQVQTTLTKYHVPFMIADLILDYCKFM